MEIANILIAALIIVAYLVLTAFYIIQQHRIEEIKDNYEKLRIDTRQQFDYKEKDIRTAKEFIFDLNRRMEVRGDILDSMRDDIDTLKKKMNKMIPDDPKKRTREEIERIKTIAKVVSQTKLPCDEWKNASLREDEAELIAEKIYDTLAPSVLEKPKK